MPSVLETINIIRAILDETAGFASLSHGARCNLEDIAGHLDDLESLRVEGVSKMECPTSTSFLLDFESREKATAFHTFIRKAMGW